MIYLILIIVAAPCFSFDFGFVIMYALCLRRTMAARLRLRRLTGLTGLKCLGTAQTYKVISHDWHHQTRNSFVFLKSPSLYICRAHSCRRRHLFADMLRVRRTRHVNSRHRQRSRCQRHLASQGTAQTCTVVQCDYSHQIRRPLLFSKLPQQSRCRQNWYRYRRLFAGMSPFRRTQPC